MGLQMSANRKVVVRMIISAEAQAKLQHMRESDDFCCITLKSDYDFVWDIYVVWSETSEYKPNEIKGHTSISVCNHSHEELDDAVEHLHQYWTSQRTRVGT